MTVITCIEDLRRLAERRVPRMLYDLVDCGSSAETTYRANETDFNQIRLRQRVAVDVSRRSVRARMLGEEVTMPVALAPAGLAGLQCANGEILVAQAAAEFGVPFALSTLSVCSIEDVAASGPAPFWFQLYVMRDRSFTERLIERARAARCAALMLTLDLPIFARRHKDLKNGLFSGWRTPANLLDIATKPRWALGMLSKPRRLFGNMSGPAGIGDPDPSLSWKDVEWVKHLWGGKLILKGIMDLDDAKQAVACGADALVVSNHGGRQLDGAPSSISALPRIAAEVGDRIEVWVDGGIRSGQDVFKALALGAHGTLIGRAYLYGLAAAGKAGVTKCLELIRNELDVTMALCGKRDVGEIDRSALL